MNIDTKLKNEMVELIGLVERLLRRVWRSLSLTYPEMEKALCSCECLQCMSSNLPCWRVLKADSLDSFNVYTGSWSIWTRHFGITKFQKNFDSELYWNKNLDIRYPIEYLHLLKSRGKQIQTTPILTTGWYRTYR